MERVLRKNGLARIHRNRRKGGKCRASALEGSIPSIDELIDLVQRRRAAEGRSADLPGEVHLVGTGPGDPGMLTLRAAQLLQQADIVLYDRLVSNEILELVGDEAMLVYVGKAKGYHSKTQQEEIQELLHFYASEAGATVVRLKGGDPLVFGRGGEEMDFLRSKGVNVRCTTGVTSAAGIASDLGIPLTHRSVAQSVKLMTGHAKGSDPELADFPLSEQDATSTLVVYMGLGTLPRVAESMLAVGVHEEAPCVVVERGTTESQRRIFSRLNRMPSDAEEGGLRSPALLIVGQVVSLSPLWGESEIGMVQNGSPAYSRTVHGQLVEWEDLKEAAQQGVAALRSL